MPLYIASYIYTTLILTLVAVQTDSCTLAGMAGDYQQIIAIAAKGIMLCMNF